MSTLEVSNLNDGTTTVATTFVTNGSAKAWANKASDGASLLDSFNISSIDDDGTGDFGIHFTSSMSNSNYSISLGGNDMGSGSSFHWVDYTNGTQTTSSFDGETGYISSSANRTNHDNQAFMSIHGDLA